jgi:hypothetical protein
MEPETRKLSTILLEAMQAKNMSLEKLAQASNISERFLEPLISDNFNKMPSSPYLHGYILKIGTLLSLDGEKLWEIYFKENDSIKKSGKTDELPKNRFEKIKFDRRILIGGALGIVVLVFVIWRVQAYFSPPPLTLQDFSENMIVENSMYDLKGQVDPKNQLLLNGEQIYPNTDGTFEKKIELQPGFNALSFKIKKFLGKEYTIEKQIFFKTDATPVKNVKRVQETTNTETGTTSASTTPTE